MADSEDKTLATRRRKQPSDEKLRNCFHRLREFYAQGHSDLKANPTRMAYGVGKKLDARGGSGEMLRKARVFAHPSTGYTEEELAELVRLCWKHSYPIGVSHIIRLLSLTDEKGKANKFLRRSLQTKAIRGDWSKRRIDQEILQIKSFRTKVHPPGRRVRGIDDPSEALFRIRLLCQQWVRLRPALSPHIAETKKLSVSVTQLDAAVHQVLNAVEASSLQPHKLPS